MRQYLIPFLVGAALIAIGIVTFQIGKARGYASGYADGSSCPVKSDTCWVVDTHFVDRPVEVVKWKEKEKPVYIPVTDTIHHHDTTFLALPREFKQYKEETFEAQVSGIDPSLDWINVHQKTAYIQNTITTRKRWSMSVTAGPGAFWNGGPVQFGVGAVVGFGYNF